MNNQQNVVTAYGASSNGQQNSKNAAIASDGENIDLKEARKEIGQYIAVQKDFDKAVAEGALDKYPAAKKYASDISKVNVYVFGRKFIERFKDSDADKYVVITGVNGLNGATVLFAGCKVLEDNGRIIKLKAVKPNDDKVKVVSEHPPKRFAGDIEDAMLTRGITRSADEDGELVFSIEK